MTSHPYDPLERDFRNNVRSLIEINEEQNRLVQLFGTGLSTAHTDYQTLQRERDRLVDDGQVLVARIGRLKSQAIFSVVSRSPFIAAVRFQGGQGLAADYSKYDPYDH